MNAHHSKELMPELYQQLQGNALSLFTSMHTQQFYLKGGHIEIINKFHLLGNIAI